MSNPSNKLLSPSGESVFWRIPRLFCTLNTNLINEASSSPIPTPLIPIAAEICVAIAILPNGANPAGWIEDFNSFMYSEIAASTFTS